MQRRFYVFILTYFGLSLSSSSSSSVLALLNNEKMHSKRFAHIYDRNFYRTYQQQLQQQHQHSHRCFARNCFSLCSLEGFFTFSFFTVSVFGFESILIMLVLLERRGLDPSASVLFSGSRSVTLQDI